MYMKTIGGIVALSLLLTLLAGCNAAGGTTPTTDPKVIYTQVGQTVQAQITNSAALTPKPSNTPQPTQTIASSSTSAPSATSVGTLAGTAVATSKAGTPAATLPVLATATLSGGGSIPVVPDKMAYVSQIPGDGAIFAGGKVFTMTWTVKNTGTTTWTTKYWVRLYGGERMGVADFNLKDTVAPNQTVKITMEMTAPKNAGKYNSWWTLSTPELVNFGSFNVLIEVK